MNSQQLKQASDLLEFLNDDEAYCQASEDRIDGARINTVRLLEALVASAGGQLPLQPTTTEGQKFYGLSLDGILLNYLEEVNPEGRICYSLVAVPGYGLPWLQEAVAHVTDVANMCVEYSRSSLKYPFNPYRYKGLQIVTVTLAATNLYQ